MQCISNNEIQIELKSQGEKEREKRGDALNMKLTGCCS